MKRELHVYSLPSGGIRPDVRYSTVINLTASLVWPELADHARGLHQRRKELAACSHSAVAAAVHICSMAAAAAMRFAAE